MKIVKISGAQLQSQDTEDSGWHSPIEKCFYTCYTINSSTAL